MIQQIILVYMLLACSLVSSAPLEGLFTGQWYWEGAPETKTFSINIRQQGKWLRGRYCAVVQNGNKIDCDQEDVENIYGVVDMNGTSSTVEFTSFFGAENGKATLKIQNGRLIWRIVRKPIGGYFYAPSEAVLDRGK
jgi:hypothetical protein